jgi:hypothetical protein
MNYVHDVSIKVDVFPDEFLPIMKAINFALFTKDFTDYVISKDDLEKLRDFLDDFSSAALNNAV